MGVDFVRPASCEISIIRHPTRLRGPSWQGWILLQHCIIPFHPQHWRGDWDWLAVEVTPIDQTGKIPPGRSSQCRSFASEVQTNMHLYDVPQEIPRSGFVCLTAVTQFSIVLQHPSVWYHFDRRHGPWYAFSDWKFANLFNTLDGTLILISVPHHPTRNPPQAAISFNQACSQLESLEPCFFPTAAVMQ